MPALVPLLLPLPLVPPHRALTGRHSRRPPSALCLRDGLHCVPLRHALMASHGTEAAPDGPGSARRTALPEAAMLILAFLEGILISGVANVGVFTGSRCRLGWLWRRFEEGQCAHQVIPGGEDQEAGDGHQAGKKLRTGADLRPGQTPRSSA